jgi:hypothetical protein
MEPVTLPDDIYYTIYKLYFDNFVLRLIPVLNLNQWMWKCSDRKKKTCLERGAIQLGYTFNDAWSRVYLPFLNPFCTCHLSQQACKKCITDCYNNNK